MEAWYFGDIDSLCSAYDRPKLKDVIRKKRFRIPYTIPDPKGELYKLIPEHQQIAGARLVAPHMNIELNTSISFQQFVRGVRRIACRYD